MPKPKITLLIILMVACLFFLEWARVNFDPVAASVYSGLLVIGLALIMIDHFYSDGKHDYPVSRKEFNWGKSIIYLVIAWIAFSGFGSIVSTAFGGSQSAIEILAGTRPVLSESKFLSDITWGLIIPFVENVVFFGLLYEFLKNVARKFGGGNLPDRLDSPNIRKFWIELLMALIIISTIFTGYHIAVRGTLDNAGLAVTFLFALVNMILILATGHLRESIILHSAINLRAISGFTELFAAYWPWILGIAIVLFLMFSKRVRQFTRR